MTKKQRKISLATSIVVGVVLLFIGLFHIYLNDKTDGFDSGRIKVSSCKVDNYNWGIYTCYGDYTSNAAMIETSNVSVKVGEGGSAKGAYINDVYPVFPDTKATAHSFITGRDRASVVHNTAWIIFILVGFLLPLGTAAYQIGGRVKSSKLVH